VAKIIHTTFILILSILLTIPSLAQNDLELTNCPDGYELAPAGYVIKVTDEMPSWPGCEKVEFLAYREDCTYKEVAKYVKENLVYPESAKEMGLEGEVWIRFVVQENGCLSNISISKTLGGHTGWTAQKLVRGMPYWNPGYKTGYFFPVQVSIPILFELNN
jgi:TonB family protein